jgi:hypothetical protein
MRLARVLTPPPRVRRRLACAAAASTPQVRVMVPASMHEDFVEAWKDTAKEARARGGRRRRRPRPVRLDCRCLLFTRSSD